MIITILSVLLLLRKDEKNSCDAAYIFWYGYFGLIDYVDEFIFLNNVQFEKDLGNLEI